MRFYLYDPQTLEFRELEGRVIVGRDRGDWIFPREKELSSEHVRFRVEAGRVFVEDLGSTNGVRVAGARIPPLQERELQLLESVRFGPKEWILCDSDQRVPRSPPASRTSEAPATPEPQTTTPPKTPTPTAPLPKKGRRRPLRAAGGLILFAIGALMYDAAFLFVWQTEQAPGYWALGAGVLIASLGIALLFARHSPSTRIALAATVTLALGLVHFMGLESSRFAFSPQALVEQRACPSLLTDALLFRARPAEHALLQDACRIRKLKHALEAHARLFCGERGAGFECFRESVLKLHGSRTLTASGDAALFFLGAFWIRRDYQSDAVSLLKTTGRAIEWVGYAARTFSDPARRSEIRPALLPLLVGPGVPASLADLTPTLATEAPHALTEGDGPANSLRKLFGIE